MTNKYVTLITMAMYIIKVNVDWKNILMMSVRREGREWERKG